MTTLPRNSDCRVEARQFACGNVWSHKRCLIDLRQVVDQLRFAWGVFVQRRVRLSMCVVVLSACSSGAASAPTTTAPSGGFRVPGAADVPEEQRAAFADGKISLQEYQQAFEQFRSCAIAGGGYVEETERDPTTGEIQYGSRGMILPPGQANGTVENGCYQRFFAQTEITFSATNTGVLGSTDDDQMRVFDQNFRPCLDHLGVPVPADLKFNDKNWIPLLDQVTDAINSGKCPPEVFNRTDAAPASVTTLG